MKHLLLSCLLFTSALFAGEINIAVAANVSYAFDELKAEFAKTHPQTKIQVTLGSSGKLTAQIKNGAPYGIFMAANMKFPQSLYEDKIAITKPAVYAQGALAYLSAKQQDFSKGIMLLEDNTIQKIAIANPKTAPYGAAAIQAINNAGIYTKVEKKFVFAESISQTVTYATTAADIGMIAKSSLYSDQMKAYKKGVNWEAVDPKLYTPIEQGIVLIRGSEKNPEYKTFYDFILSQKAKEIFRAYGYIVE
ncbi:MAG: molybdate ABC transporter substrate-binding protein [Campylobacterales bacterium]|nr:molybdate ABC transporter substrate-binding protein [Campylobacterales bacterium]